MVKEFALTVWDVPYTCTCEGNRYTMPNMLGVEGLPRHMGSDTYHYHNLCEVDVDETEIVIKITSGYELEDLLGQLVSAYNSVGWECLAIKKR
jgi:hypothetical protein